MNLLYTIPFSYFYFTRLRHASPMFHVLFEWIAAVCLVVAFGRFGLARSLYVALLAYCAFICVYEIGYFANDLFSAKREVDGRPRGPQDASGRWLSAWVGTRAVAFLAITVEMIPFPSLLEWGAFFGALTVPIAAHNLMVDRELKSISFIWLSWFRFMAPVIFAVDSGEVLGIGLCAALSYCNFRLFGYLDGKGLLRMPGRRRRRFGLLVFSAPVCGALALWPYNGFAGFFVLSVFYFAVASLGVAVEFFLKVALHAPRNSQDDTVE